MVKTNMNTCEDYHLFSNLLFCLIQFAPFTSDILFFSFLFCCFGFLLFFFVFILHTGFFFRSINFGNLHHYSVDLELHCILRWLWYLLRLFMVNKMHKNKIQVDLGKTSNGDVTTYFWFFWYNKFYMYILNYFKRCYIWWVNFSRSTIIIVIFLLLMTYFLAFFLLLFRKIINIFISTSIAAWVLS